MIADEDLTAQQSVLSFNEDENHDLFKKVTIKSQLSPPPSISNIN